MEVSFLPTHTQSVNLHLESKFQWVLMFVAGNVFSNSISIRLILVESQL